MGQGNVELGEALDNLEKTLERCLEGVRQLSKELGTEQGTEQRVVTSGAWVGDNRCGFELPHAGHSYGGRPGNLEVFSESGHAYWCDGYV